LPKLNTFGMAAPPLEGTAPNPVDRSEAAVLAPNTLGAAPPNGFAVGAEASATDAPSPPKAKP
jgi:hypothetical protein